MTTTSTRCCPRVICPSWPTWGWTRWNWELWRVTSTCTPTRSLRVFPKGSDLPSPFSVFSTRWGREVLEKYPENRRACGVDLRSCLRSQREYVAGAEVELDDVDLIDDVTDLKTDFALERGSELALLLVEADDEWFALVRAEEDAEPRVYLSDVRAVHEHVVASVLSEAGGMAVPQLSESAGARPNPSPDGDGRLLTDFGITEEELHSLSAGGGILPSDVLAVVAERAGFADLLDEMGI